MPDIVTSKIFVDGEKGITATKMNQIISGSTIQPDFVGTKPATSTVASNDQLLILKTDNTYARAPFSTVSGSVATQLSAVVIGDTTTTPSGPAIIVPRYKNHPDAIWTYSTFDDHFDNPASGTPNVKWVYTVTGPAGLVNPVYGQAGSRLFMSQQGAADTTGRAQSLVQNLPSSNPLTLTAKVDLTALPYYAIGSGTISSAYFDLYLVNVVGGGLTLGYEADYLQASGICKSWLSVHYGSPASSNSFFLYSPKLSLYLRLQYLSDQTAYAQVSSDGINFITVFNISGINSGFNAAPPSVVKLFLTTNNSAFALVSIDWIRVTYP